MHAPPKHMLELSCVQIHYTGYRVPLEQQDLEKKGGLITIPGALYQRSLPPVRALLWSKNESIECEAVNPESPLLQAHAKQAGGGHVRGDNQSKLMDDTRNLLLLVRMQFYNTCPKLCLQVASERNKKQHGMPEQLLPVQPLVR